MKATAAARRLGVSPQRVRQLDDVLNPMRTEDGTRLYRADEIERVAARRDARRAAPKAPRPPKPPPPKYGVPDLARALGVKPQSLRVLLRRAGVPKAARGWAYGWDTQAEMQDVVSRIRGAR